MFWLPIEEAKKKGAVAMFGEKYGDVVRVVEMGDVSMEFCGGTHLDNTAKVGLFRIKSEGSVASGVRRIEAITGKQTLEELRSGQEKLIRAAQLLKTTSNELESRIGGMLSEMKEIKSQLEKFKEQASLGEARTFLTSAKEVKGLKLGWRRHRREPRRDRHRQLRRVHLHVRHIRLVKPAAERRQIGAARKYFKKRCMLAHCCSLSFSISSVSASHRRSYG
mgnify:CR=1 FL=1